MINTSGSNPDYSALYRYSLMPSSTVFSTERRVEEIDDQPGYLETAKTSREVERALEESDGQVFEHSVALFRSEVGFYVCKGERETEKHSIMVRTKRSRQLNTKE